MAPTHAETVLQLAQRRGIIRPLELEPHGIPRSVLARMVERGDLVRIGRGLYKSADSEFTEHHSLAAAAKLVPGGVVCLLSALRFHDMTTESPFEVWMCLDHHDPTPRFEYPPLRVVRASAKVREFGRREHRIERVPVWVTTPAKTVADCFKHRNKVGTSVAVAALSDYLRDRRGTPDELWEACKVCRMTRVIAPYLEALS